MKLTDNQQIHRAYLQSPIWKQKRIEALEFYGCICSRCREYGNDVHHKTYDRVGGGELMDDLEVLCRGCHEAHHRVDKMVSRHPRSSVRGINRKAIFSSLNRRMKETLKRDFHLSTEGELYLKIASAEDDIVARAAAKLIGCDFVFGGNGKKSVKQRAYGQQDRNRWSRI